MGSLSLNMELTKTLAALFLLCSVCSGKVHNNLFDNYIRKWNNNERRPAGVLNAITYDSIRSPEIYREPEDLVGEPGIFTLERLRYEISAKSNEPSVPTTEPKEPTPIILWHGMGDSCCAPWSMGYVKKLLEKHIPGIYVRSLMLGESVYQDTEHGFFEDVNEQVGEVCQKIAEDPKLQNGFNAIGFSQGGQFLRAVAQRCPQGMKVLVTFGAQHQGIYGLPQCLGEQHFFCDYARRLLNYGAYISWIQKTLVQAQYWHDPLDEQTYKAKSLFLADINNEVTHNQDYKDNLMKLEKFVMVKFADDTVVDPKASEWFEFYAPGQADQILPLNQSQIYLEDRLGLQEMDNNGQLAFLSTPGNHMNIKEDFLAEIVDEYLRN